MGRIAKKKNSRAQSVNPHFTEEKKSGGGGKLTRES